MEKSYSGNNFFGYIKWGGGVIMVMSFIRKYWDIIFIIVIGVLPLIPLFHSGLPITNDGQDHVARIANFYQNLEEGNLIPRWANNLNWGYGHPILMFLYPLSSYISSFFHFVGFSFVDSLKIVFGIAFLASGLTMFLWIKSFTNNTAALSAAILYMFAPYRFIDLYTRGAIGEHVAFIFPPLILYFVLCSYKKYSFWYVIGGAISLCSLILAHNAISLMFIPIIGLYFLFLFFKTKIRKKFLISFLGIVLLGFSLSSFFWAPAFFEGKYTLRDKVVAGEYSNRFIPIQNLFYDPVHYNGNMPFTMKINIFQWIIVLLSFVIVCKSFLDKNKKNFVLSLGVVFIFLISFFLITDISKSIWEKIILLQNFQFPWRFLSVSTFAIAVLGGIFFSNLSKKIAAITLIFLIVGLFFSTKSLWKVDNYLKKPESFYTGIYNSTTDTGESAPIWSVRFMLKRPKDYIEIIDGDAKIEEVSRSITNREYVIDAAANSRLLENTLYFPGWKVFVDGKKQNIEFQDENYRGLMTFYVNKGNHLVNISFGETKLRLLADLISLFSAVFLIGFIAFNLWTKGVYNKIKK